VNPDTIKTIKTDEQWRQQLTPQQYEVLRRGGSEPPFSGEYAFSKEDSGLEIGRGGNGAHLFHLHDGKVTRLVAYDEPERALADLGLAPETQ
jgi:hypothetical protein